LLAGTLISLAIVDELLGLEPGSYIKKGQQDAAREVLDFIMRGFGLADAGV
jgi:hypothetical protein